MGISLLQALADDAGVRTIKAFGPVGRSDDTNTFAAAVQSGETVLVPPLPGGASYKVDHIAMPKQSALIGLGRATVIEQLVGANGALIRLADPRAGGVTLRSLVLYGNRAEQTNVNPGLRFEGTFNGADVRTYNPFNSDDPRHTIADVLICDFKGRALELVGRGASKFDGVQAFHCEGGGFYIDGYDNVFQGCDIGACGAAGSGANGVELATANGWGNRFIGTKAWFSGGHNWRIDGSSNVFTGCIGQDSSFDDWCVTGNDNALVGIVSDSAGKLSDPGTRAGITLDGCARTRVAGSICDRGAIETGYGLRFLNTPTSVLVDVTVSQMVVADYVGTWAGSVVINGDVVGS